MDTIHKINDGKKIISMDVTTREFFIYASILNVVQLIFGHRSQPNNYELQARTVMI